MEEEVSQQEATTIQATEKEKGMDLMEDVVAIRAMEEILTTLKGVASHGQLAGDARICYTIGCIAYTLTRTNGG